MSSFPSSPRLLKGAIIGIDPFNPVANVIIFQYNPETLKRTLTPQTTGSDNADKGEALRLKGPPRETITLPEISGKTPRLKELLQESRDIISHPYEGTWWMNDVTKFIREHPKQIAAEIEARNRGYTLLRETKTK